MNARFSRGSLAVVAAAATLSGWLGATAQPNPAAAPAAPPAEATPTVVCNAPDAGDQDDLCIWVHPDQPALSTVITSDKAAGKVFVYDLAGKVVQTIDTPYPGNIDVRRGFAFGGRKLDIVAFNQRTSGRHLLRVLAVDPASRKLTPIDAGGLDSGPNYGGTLFRSPKTGKTYWLNTFSGVEQYELVDQDGKLAARKVRSWKLGLCEGAVGDDETGKVYVAEEARGVWEVAGEPDSPAPGRLIARVGDNGLRADVEGLAVYPQAGGKGYLLVSSQGSDCFKVYRRDGAHEYVGTFTIGGARDTDGIDVTPAALGPAFPRGLFGCHSNTAVNGSCPVLLTPWEKIAEKIAGLRS